MRRRGRSSAGRWALAALAVVALAGGVAWADAQEVMAPPGPDVTVVAVLVPGPGGGEVCGDIKGDEFVDFNVGGGIRVHGEVLAGNNPEDAYSVTYRYRHELEQSRLDITVVNETTGELVYLAMDIPVVEAPSSFSANGAQVLSLTAE
jgi:hypothetical protein